MNALKSLSLLAVMMLATPGAIALELFGVSLESTSRDELREAAKQAGLSLIREGGDDNWFDLYDSSTVLAGSSRFYLGFVKQNQQFAFAEYEFHGLNTRRMLGDLIRKYGAAEVRQGRFVSDRSYHWQQDGIRIDLFSDWHRYKTRLSYTHPANLAELLAERDAGSSAGEDEAAAISVF